jgi:hypothetical protein
MRYLEDHRLASRFRRPSRFPRLRATLPSWSKSLALRFRRPNRFPRLKPTLPQRIKSPHVATGVPRNAIARDAQLTNNIRVVFPKEQRTWNY